LTERSHLHLDTGVTDGYHYCGCDNSPSERIKYSTTDSHASTEELELERDMESDPWIKESRSLDILNKKKMPMMDSLKDGMKDIVELELFK